MMSLQVRLVWHISHCISWRLCFFWFTDIFAAQEVQRGNATEVAAVDSSSPFSVSWSLNGSTPMGESKTFWKLTATQSVKFGRKRTASADHMCHTCVSVLQLCPTLSGLRGQRSAASTPLAVPDSRTGISGSRLTNRTKTNVLIAVDGLATSESSQTAV